MGISFCSKIAKSLFCSSVLSSQTAMRNSVPYWKVCCLFLKIVLTNIFLLFHGYQGGETNDGTWFFIQCEKVMPGKCTALCGISFLMCRAGMKFQTRSRAGASLKQQRNLWRWWQYSSCKYPTRKLLYSSTQIIELEDTKSMTPEWLLTLTTGPQGFGKLLQHYLIVPFTGNSFSHKKDQRNRWSFLCKL